MQKGDFFESKQNERDKKEWIRKRTHSINYHTVLPLNISVMPQTACVVLRQRIGIPCYIFTILMT